MLIGIDTSPCVVSLRNRSIFSSQMTSCFSLVLSSVNHNFGYGNQRQLFAGNLPDMFNFLSLKRFVNSREVTTKLFFAIGFMPCHNSLELEH